MPRPKFSKDKKKRKKKCILSGSDERSLIQDYESGISTVNLITKYNVTKTYISNMFKRRKVLAKINRSTISSWENIEDLGQLKENIGGVYAIYFIDKKDPNYVKLYIGSSTNIGVRLGDHYRALKNEYHSSKNLTSMFNNNNYTMHYAIIERCDADQVMQKESDYLAKWSKSCLLNTWAFVSSDTLKPWLEGAVKRKSYCKQYKINSATGCKESISVHKSGYARMRVFVGDQGQKKYLYKHRVAYWEKYGEYPELIRHTCNNPKCYNADHLVKGNHRDNALDKRKGFAEEFEAKWIEYGADLVKLNDYFGNRWKRSMALDNNMVSPLLYIWERKLDLREKYPDIIKNNTNRRMDRFALNREV